MANEKNQETLKSIKSGLSGIKNKIKEDTKEIKEEKAIAAEAEKEVDEFAANLEKEMAAKKVKDLMGEAMNIGEEDLANQSMNELLGLPEKYEPSDFLLKLIDPKNTDPIKLVDQNDEEVYFEQVAVLPWNDKLFAILKPEDGAIDGVEDDEAFVFSVEYDAELGTDLLVRVTDDTDVEILFQMYYDLLADQGVTE